jgi:GT2 family glycosyltransferase/MoaA/NifB/PqqE/SkfB family radical SAM enzyme
MTEPLPTQMWIELTSRGPFDCIFCSRKLRRGAGEHMDWGLYQSLISQLESPDVIRLNYSGESIHYPHVIDAIRLAKSTGARTELVSAFASIPDSILDALPGAGLDRLTISLHTLDDRQFGEIYRFSSLARMKWQLARLRTMIGDGPPMLDFAFVALDRNVDQLELVAAFAQSLGIPEVAIFPVIKRDPIPEPFLAELDTGNRLTNPFKDRLRDTIESVERKHPGVHVLLSTPELTPSGCLTEGPRYYTDPLPPDARIWSCDQSPWDTIHVLANGDVTVCEVHDRVPVGNLARQSLQEIWHGKAYRDFRTRYRNGAVPECHTCSWKQAYIPPARIWPWAGADWGIAAQFLAGWYRGRDKGIVWSRPAATLVLQRPGMACRVRVRGILPPAKDPEGNELEISVDGVRASTVVNLGDDLLEFHSTFDTRPSGSPNVELTFRTKHVYRPAGPDVRSLGFALIEAEASATPAEPGSWPAAIAALALAPAFGFADKLCRAVRRVRRAPVVHEEPFRPGVSVVIPARDNPELLARCLASLAAAAVRIDEPVETIVVVNGIGKEPYRDLVDRYPGVRWLWFTEPLSFSRAVAEGLSETAYDWIYLLNNDMTLDPEALSELLPLRAPRVFAIASQIFPAAPDQFRDETNWTDWHFPGGVVEILDVPPDDDADVRGSLYAGGGSSLMRRRLLLELVARTGTAYDPFYWEDVEWGTVAQKMGYRVLFCPSSKVFHVHRATVSLHFPPDEVERIFRRNGYLFQLRTVTGLGSLVALARSIARADGRTQRELLRPATLAAALKSRIACHFLPLGDRDLCGLRRVAVAARAERAAPFP